MKKIIFLLTVLLPIIAFSQVEDYDSPSEIRRETNLEVFGDYAQHVPALTSLIMIIVKKDKKGFWQFAKSYGTTLGVTYALKYAIDKPRPDGRTDGHAFPSGHTAVAFSGASFIQRRYGWKYGIPAYALSGVVAYSRLEGINDRHDGWDVLGGILVGVGSTYLFTTPYQRKHYELSFKSGEASYLVGINYKF
ncbi:phosphatase PAP2 family protein [Algibacter lectus]|uniref:PAP2 superfamily protein n=1 Tax=Algibacter lectus TaxID=221126 RepID=A0A4V3HGC0_9FLAO|nr:phosphatase PAP2 family protein [Algibacter lectus]MWW26023.1 phosphatase PAP2 family protein [Algibacter lectus]TDY60751.1 PAP2 superfamily protein [Algibacter lectus]